VGELERVLAAGGDPGKVVFSGVAKREDEIARALAIGIRCFNVESEPELLLINRVAGGMAKRAAVSLRVNPDVDANTHPYIATGLKENKFGIDINQAPAIYALAAQLPYIQVVGIDCHIGSQLIQVDPMVAALERFDIWILAVAWEFAIKMKTHRYLLNRPQRCWKSLRVYPMKSS
jgi:diaminopimelate decarboxylase